MASGPKTLSGTVVSIYASGVVFTNGTAAKYRADFGNAQLSRKNGAAMSFAEILVGDKLQVTGTLWSDNSISATSVRDLSLYAHSGTFSGKITGIDIAGLSFTMQTTGIGIQTIKTNSFTAFTKNKSSATFNDLAIGMAAAVKGIWDRSRLDVTASQVQGTLRLVNIDFTGTLYGINGSGLTIIGNGNVMYGVDASKAKLLDKNGKAVVPSALNIGDTLSVHGEHVSGSVSVNGLTIKVTKAVK